MIKLEKNLGGERRIFSNRLGLMKILLMGAMLFNGVVYSQEKKEEKDELLEWILQPENLIPLTDYGMQNAESKFDRDVAKALNTYAEVFLLSFGKFFFK